MNPNAALPAADLGFIFVSPGAGGEQSDSGFSIRARDCQEGFSFIRYGSMGVTSIFGTLQGSIHVRRCHSPATITLPSAPVSTA